MWDETDVRLVPYEWLKPHEEIKPRNRDKLLEMTLVGVDLPNPWSLISEQVRFWTAITAIRLQVN